MIMRSLKSVTLAAATLAIAASLCAPAAAATERSRDHCMQLASQRGFSASGGATDANAKREFVISCRQPKQG